MRKDAFQPFSAFAFNEIQIYERDSIAYVTQITQWNTDFFFRSSIKFGVWKEYSLNSSDPPYGLRKLSVRIFTNVR